MEKSENEEKIDKIVSNYETKIKNENEKMYSEKNKFEINKDLKSFEEDKKTSLLREKMTIMYGNSIDDIDDVNNS